MKTFEHRLRFYLISGFLALSGILNGQNLQILVEEALERNPEIQAFELQYDIASEKVREVNTVPNTEFGFGYFVSEPETRTGSQRFKISAMQMIPWFGTITSRENYASSLADSKYEDIVIAKRKLIASVSRSYYELYALKAKQAILTENIDLLETYQTMALTSVEVGKASAVDVLRLQIRQNELEELLQVLSHQYESKQIEFNKLLNRDDYTPVEVVDVLKVPEQPERHQPVNLTIHPELTRFDKLYASVEQSEIMNQKESNSMIGFGLDYIYVEKRPDMDFSDNGKDVLMPMISLSIPIFNKKYRSQTRQNELKQLEIESQKKDRLNKLESLLQKALNDRETASISHQTQTRNLQEAKSAEEILIKNYETGTIDFKDVLDIQELQLKFQLSQVESVKTYFEQTTIINYLST